MRNVASWAAVVVVVDLDDLVLRRVGDLHAKLVRVHSRPQATPPAPTTHPEACVRIGVLPEKCACVCTTGGIHR